MGALHGIFQLGKGEVGGLGAHTELIGGQIYGIGAETNGVVHLFGTTCRGQQFHLCA